MVCKSLFDEREKAKQIEKENIALALQDIMTKVEELKDTLNKFPSNKFPITIETRLLNSKKWLVSFEEFLKNRVKLKSKQMW